MLILATVQVNGQEIIKEADTEKNAVIGIMKSYQEALENLNTEGTIELFSEDSEVIESGGVEGSFANYNEHHLGPELVHFQKFEFSNYEIDVVIELPFAFTTETYRYTIDLKPDDKGDKRTIEREGVTSSILKKSDGKWKIYKSHSSSRNYK
tara:strand:+ start:70 stop:525 length:456 start_codon:yes stop_codon:yes gene_type:complete